MGHSRATLSWSSAWRAFDFNSHMVPDNDWCPKFDRERIEIRTEGNSSAPDYLKGFLGDTETFRWRFDRQFI